MRGRRMSRGSGAIAPTISAARTTATRACDPPVLVTREVLLVKDGPDVLVRDSVDGSGSRELVWRFHLDPARRRRRRRTRCPSGGGDREAWLQMVDRRRGPTLTIEDGWISPSYGVRVKTHVVVIDRADAACRLARRYRIGAVRLAASSLQSLAALLPTRPREAAVGGRADRRPDSSAVNRQIDLCVSS